MNEQDQVSEEALMNSNAVPSCWAVTFGNGWWWWFNQENGLNEGPAPMPVQVDVEIFLAEVENR